MSITPFLRNQAFEPETLAAMSRAYQAVCRKLGLADRDDALNEIIAKHLVSLAQTGIHNPTTLYMGTVKEFKSNPK